ILKATNEIISRLPRDHLAVGLAGVAQDDAKDVGLAPLAVGSDERSPRAEVDLGLFARWGLKPTHRVVRVGREAADEASHAEVAPVELLLGGRVLINPLGRQAELDLGLNGGSPGLAATESSGSGRGEKD